MSHWGRVSMQALVVCCSIACNAYRHHDVTWRGKSIQPLPSEMKHCNLGLCSPADHIDEVYFHCLGCGWDSTKFYMKLRALLIGLLRALKIFLDSAHCKQDPKTKFTIGYKAIRLEFVSLQDAEAWAIAGLHGGRHCSSEWRTLWQRIRALLTAAEWHPQLWGQEARIWRPTQHES